MPGPVDWRVNEKAEANRLRNQPTDLQKSKIKTNQIEKVEKVKLYNEGNSSATNKSTVPARVSVRTSIWKEASSQLNINQNTQ